MENNKDIKYILISGGVISGVGKGVITSSVGTLLKSIGLNVTAIKVDPYLNIDAGTFSPYEHGEVFVLDDGGEVDLDLGNYERFLDVTLMSDNNITTGKIYKHVIEKERRGSYLGKTVQVVPHVTDAIQEWVERVAQIPVSADNRPDVCVIELGGTIGDIEGMPFIEAFRQFQFKINQSNFCNIHVSLVPETSGTCEQKTKPTQNSVKELRSCGLSPDLIVCRSQHPISSSVKEKISNFCHVKPEQVVSVHDCTSIYRVPLLLNDQGVLTYLINRLGLPQMSPKSSQYLHKWKKLADRHDNLHHEVKIVLVGKYTKSHDSYLSLIKALKHASIACKHKLVLLCIEAEDLESECEKNDPALFHSSWQQLCNADGIIVPGGFGSRGTEGKISAIKYAREKKIPFLGVCFGMQLAVIEFARNVLKWEGANSTEIDPATKHPVVIEMPEHNIGDLGGTMRLGRRKTIFKQDCIIKKLYGSVEGVDERHRHRYEVNPKIIEDVERSGMQFVGHDSEGERMEIMELKDHPYFVGVQFHPEYLTRPLKPSPPYLGLLLASCQKLDVYLNKGFRLSPTVYEYDSDDDAYSSEMSSLAKSDRGSGESGESQSSL